MRIRNTKGFTLIEVLIALSIIAISLIAAVKASTEVTRNLSHIQEKTKAHFVANNVLSDILAGQAGYYLSVGDRQGDMEFDDTTWYWRAKITSDAPHMLQVSVDVRRDQNGTSLTQYETYVFDNKS